MLVGYQAADADEPRRGRTTYGGEHAPGRPVRDDYHGCPDVEPTPQGKASRRRYGHNRVLTVNKAADRAFESAADSGHDRRETGGKLVFVHMVYDQQDGDVPPHNERGKEWGAVLAINDDVDRTPVEGHPNAAG